MWPTRLPSKLPTRSRRFHQECDATLYHQRGCGIRNLCYDPPVAKRHLPYGARPSGTYAELSTITNTCLKFPHKQIVHPWSPNDEQNSFTSPNFGISLFSQKQQQTGVIPCTSSMLWNFGSRGASAGERSFMLCGKGRLLYAAKAAITRSIPRT
jgi:hypothetical protein